MNQWPFTVKEEASTTRLLSPLVNSTQLNIAFYPKLSRTDKLFSEWSLALIQFPKKILAVNKNDLLHGNSCFSFFPLDTSVNLDHSGFVALTILLCYKCHFSTEFALLNRCRHGPELVMPFKFLVMYKFLWEMPSAIHIIYFLNVIFIRNWVDIVFAFMFLEWILRVMMRPFC